MDKVVLFAEYVRGPYSQYIPIVAVYFHWNRWPVYIDQGGTGILSSSLGRMRPTMPRSGGIHSSQGSPYVARAMNMPVSCYRQQATSDTDQYSS